MTILLSLLVIVAISLVAVRVGAVALTMTGLARDVADFQAQSAFSGVGFTTSESEAIVSHPVRRRIVRLLMLLGTAGLTSAIATLVLTFTTSKGEDRLMRAGLVAGGMGALWLLARSKLIDRVMTRAIRRALASATSLHLGDYEEMLQLARGYAVAQVVAKPGSWLVGRTPRQLNLTAEGIVILNITRADGVVLGTPMPDAMIEPGDKLLCYGHSGEIEGLAARDAGPAGDEAHALGLERNAARQHMERVEDLTPGPSGDPDGPAAV